MNFGAGMKQNEGGFRLCQATTREGKPCNRRPLQGEDFCLPHHPDPEIKERHREISRKGGSVSPTQRAIEVVSKPNVVANGKKFKNGADNLEFLAQTINEVREGKMHPYTARTIMYGIQISYSAKSNGMILPATPNGSEISKAEMKKADEQKGISDEMEALLAKKFRIKTYDNEK